MLEYCLVKLKVQEWSWLFQRDSSSTISQSQHSADGAKRWVYIWELQCFLSVGSVCPSEYNSEISRFKKNQNIAQNDSFCLLSFKNRNSSILNLTNSQFAIAWWTSANVKTLKKKKLNALFSFILHLCLFSGKQTKHFLILSRLLMQYEDQ